MTITVYELQDDKAKLSERQSTHSGEVNWMIQGTFDRDEAYEAGRAEVADTIIVGDETLYLNTFEIESIEADLWKGVASYVSEEQKNEQEQNNNDEPEEGEIIWEFDTTGATQHITSSYETRIFGDGDDNRVFTQYSNAINCRKTKTGWEVKGVDVIIPALEITATFSVPPDAVTIDWIKNVARATGKTNSLPWKGFEAGELLFKGARIRAELGDKTIIVFTFSASENIDLADNVKVGDIGPIIKPGHSYLWVEYTSIDEFDRNGRPAIFPRAKYAYVEKIYREFDFAALGAP